MDASMPEVDMLKQLGNVSEHFEPSKPSELSYFLILFASQTGNAQDVAERIGREARRHGYIPRVLPLDSFDPYKLSLEKFAIFVVSTTGQGEPPTNMRKFWKLLLKKNLPGSFLKGFHFSVFGLGDSGYSKFNIVAKKLDKRILDLGANPMLPRGLGDDQNTAGYEGALDPWLEKFWKIFPTIFTLPEKKTLSNLSLKQTSDSEPALDPPKFKIIYQKKEANRIKNAFFDENQSLNQNQNQNEYVNGQEFVNDEKINNENINDENRNNENIDNENENRENEIDWKEFRNSIQMMEEITKMSTFNFTNYENGPNFESNYSIRNPCFAPIISNERITDENYDKEVRLIKFDLSNTNINYSPGDVLYILPFQKKSKIKKLMDKLNWNANEDVSVELNDADFFSNTFFPGGEKNNLKKNNFVKIKNLIFSTLDVTSASPRRYFFEVLSHFASDEREKEKLKFFSSNEGKEELYEYNNKEKRTVLEILDDFPSVQSLPLFWLVQTAPRLQPRAFSIASSLAANPNQAHIAVDVVRWKTPYQRNRFGLCSHWLSQLKPGQIVPIWVEKGTLALPPVNIPLVLIGPGTGCAPFRAFIQERSHYLRNQIQSLSDNIAQPEDFKANGGPSQQVQETSVAPVMFFFGCRNEQKDFLFAEEWRGFKKDNGVLSTERGGGFYAAFSRDQTQKVYVQHRVREQGHKIWNLLNRDGVIFIAGSASKMPSDVSEALKEVIAEEGNMTREAAAAWLRQLERLGRFYIEAWS